MPVLGTEGACGLFRTIRPAVDFVYEVGLRLRSPGLLSLVCRLGGFAHERHWRSLSPKNPTRGPRPLHRAIFLARSNDTAAALGLV